MWSEEAIKNRETYVQTIEVIKKLPESQEGTFLHMGCGQNILEGWDNIDKFQENPKIINQDIYNLNYPENSIQGIYSSHSLEHLPIRHARLALKNWYKMLKPGASLYLAVPDLELTMKYILKFLFFYFFQLKLPYFFLFLFFQYKLKIHLFYFFL